MNRSRARELFLGASPNPDPIAKLSARGNTTAASAKGRREARRAPESARKRKRKEKGNAFFFPPRLERAAALFLDSRHALSLSLSFFSTSTLSLAYPPQLSLQQATLGDVQGDRPGFLSLEARAKYDHWAKLAGMSKEEAMQAYIDLMGDPEVWEKHEMLSQYDPATFAIA